MAYNGSGTYQLPVGNPVVTGSTISSTDFNNTMTDIATALTTAVTRDGQSPATANLPMGNFKHTGVANASARTDYAAAGQIQDGGLVLLNTIGGTGDAITANSTPTFAAYAAGQKFRFVAAAANTGAVTININAVGAKAVTKLGATALVANDILLGAIVEVVYDGTQFQLTNLVAQNATNATTHIANPTAAHAASAIANTPAGSIASTDVQAAINELDIEKAPLASPTFTGVPAAPTAAIGTNTTQLATTAFVNPAASIAASGYVKLPSGLIIQWGSDTANAANHIVSFPLTFSLCYSVIVSGAATGTYFIPYNSTLTAAGYTQGFYSNTGASGAAATWTGRYIAIGI